MKQKSKFKTTENKFSEPLSKTKKTEDEKNSEKEYKE